MTTLVILTCEHCGHTTPASTPARAAYGIRKHSCATVRERQARAQRRLDRLALSGPETPCQHNDRHPHGHRDRYVTDKCRCRPCRDAAAAYTRDLTRRHAYGNTPYVDAAPARAHIRALQAQGMGWKRVAITAGIHTSVVWKIIYGDATRNMAPSKRIRPTTEQAILAVNLNLAGGTPVDPTGTTRRIQALVANGWSQSKIAARLAIAPSNFGATAHGRRAVSAANAKATSELYDELWDQTPPRGNQRDRIAYSRSVRYAADAGWAVPMAWDTDTIDNPDALPNPGEELPRRGGGRIHIEDVEFLVDNGLTLDQVADRLKVNKNSIEHACTRGDRRDILARLHRNKTVQEYAA